MATVNVRVPKTAELVAGYIRRQIVRGELGEGDALPSETALMGELAISRPTLREAFRILESEGLIDVRRGARGGARAQIPRHDVAARYAGLVLQHRGVTLADVLDARVVVEAPAARILAERRDRVAVAAELRRWLDRQPSEVLPPAQWMEYNHLVIRLTENETLILLASMLEYISEAAAARYMSVQHPDDVRLARRAVRTRARLAELVHAGDGDGAEDLWRTHLSESNKVLLSDVGTSVVDLFA
jgi:DNA-binding FadR family transcriptional regulator